MARTAIIERKTTETAVSVEINLDGQGEGSIATTIPFLDHMLSLLTKHGPFDLTVRSKGDTDVDDHHLAEDLGICLGSAVKDALGNKEGLTRYGEATVPMDECLCSVALDISGRPYLIYNADLGAKKIGKFDPALLKEFFKAFSDHSGVTLHINLLYGRNNHHMAEAIFKALARALKKAVTIDGGIKGVLSTKGVL
ncbi:MAG TPA: imidazoleglycerol-phosphate dehydratase HisB [Syntrophales bacterium]|nr:imidazoleglycerol-phosphate dehydratase HisB [Syntrophales bacterium]